MEREKITSVDYLDITAIKSETKVKRYEIKPKLSEGFYRISEDTIETGTVYFPAVLGLDNILKDIRKAKTE
ncbi:MAG: hypothetical protein IKT61_01800 [Clostridia bacterium]|nr:hypothetical protein [Clostridia bacterium]